MGNYLQFNRPIQDNEQAFDKTEIHRGATQTGSFTLLTTIDIEDLDYFDATGASSDWYKVRYKNTISSIFSNFSAPAQSGSQKIYCGGSEVLDICGLKSTELPDNITFDRIQTLCLDASMEVDGITRTVHGRAEEFTECIDSHTLYENYIQLPYRDILFITSVSLKQADNSWTELNPGMNGQYEYDLKKGRIYLHFPIVKHPYRGYQDIRIIGNVGNIKVGDDIRLITKYIAAIKTLVSLSGGSYNSVNSYSMGKVSYNFGNRTANLASSTQSLQEELDRVLERMGIGKRRFATRIA